MPTQLPTKTVCLNCDFEVKTENRYCPNCGQENADKRISLLLLLQDAFSTVFNFESRVFKTIPYFLFYPGRLTNEFLEGKRVRYMHPFKIYLLSSIVFFFVVIKLFTPAIEGSIRKISNISVDENSDINVTLNNLDEEEKLDSLSTKLIEKITQKQILIKDSLFKVIKSLEKGQLNDSTINIDSLQNLVNDSAALSENLLVIEQKMKSNGNGLRRFFRLIQDRKMTADALLDSLNNESKDAINVTFAEQLLKIGRNDSAIFLANIINNIGTLMFITLPILAFLFVPFYLRRKKYYIDHLIFTLHLQSFTFVVLTLSAICFHWNLYSINIALFVLLIIYVWFAFKKVYKQGFIKTAIKAYMISFLYVNTLVIMLSINLVYSIFMF